MKTPMEIANVIYVVEFLEKEYEFFFHFQLANVILKQPTATRRLENVFAPRKASMGIIAMSKLDN